MLKLIIFLCFITALMIAYTILKYVFVKQSSISRLKKYTSIDELRDEKKKIARKDLKAGISFMSKGIADARFLDGYKKSIQYKLVKAHILMKPEEFITINIIAFIGAGLVGFLIKESLILAVLFGIIGWIIPSIVINAKISKRIKFLNEQLGDALMLISNSLKAGYSFFQAVDIVAREMSGPISEEFALLLKEINLGLTTEKALENLGARVQSDDLDLIVTAVMIQRQVGGNLAEVLDNISTTIRDRVKIKADIRVVTAQGRVSGLIISLLPPIICVLLFFINRSYMSTLFQNPIGIGILIFSGFMELLGIYFIGKVVKIEI